MNNGWMRDPPRAPWWKFWDLESGVIGGMIFGAVLCAVLILFGIAFGL